MKWISTVKKSLIIHWRRYMNKIAIKDCDIIFLSYDEPNCEKNYAVLKQIVPWAKRVHGVEGSDTAHKACADLSQTEYFLTVDGDTQINPKILDVVLDLESMGMDSSWIFSWSGHINVNGLKYGNGSLKLWTRTFVKEMKTHENYTGNDSNEVEFCYFNTGTTITSTSDRDIYIVSALASFSGDFGTVTVGANQSLNPTYPIKISSPVVSGTARSLFYYFD